MSNFVQDIINHLSGARRRTHSPYTQIPNEDLEIEELHHSDEAIPRAIRPSSASFVAFPTQQIAVLLVLALVEPINYSQKSPNIPQLIQDLGITGNDKRKVGYYSGMIDTSYSFVEGIFILQWSRISDRIGRKPVLLLGAIGLGLSTMLFGMSKSFLGILLSAALGGALNANWAVTRSAMADILDNSEFARTIVWQPVMWSVGSVIGSLTGGSLSHPYEKYPALFGNTKLWKNYPYLLPCVLGATFASGAFVIGFLFLKETLPRTPIKNPTGDNEEYELLEARLHPLSPSTSTVISPTILSSPSLRSLLTKPMVILLINYSIFCFHEILFGSIVTLFLASPQNAGGLDFTTDQIGFCLAALGIYNSLFQILVFSKIERRWGSTKMIRFAMIALAVMYLLFPINAWMAKTERLGAMTWVVLASQGLISPFAWSAATCFAISLTVVTPPSSYGAANGIMQSSAAIARIVTPTAASALFALSVEKEILGGDLVYYVGGMTALIGYLTSGYLSFVKGSSRL